MLLQRLFLRTFRVFGGAAMIRNPYACSVVVPFQVQEKSTFVNFAVPEATLQKALAASPGGNFTAVPVDLGDGDKFIVTANIYNVSSPLFPRETTRIEVNTYVKDGDGRKATLVLAQASNALSVDPHRLFIPPATACRFKTSTMPESVVESRCAHVDSKDVSARLVYEPGGRPVTPAFCLNVLEHTTLTAYLGSNIYDRVTWDHSAHQPRRHARVCREAVVHLHCLNLTFTQPISVFSTERPLNFVGEMWANLP